MKIQKVVLDNSTKIVNRAVKSVHRDTSRVHNYGPKMSAARINLELRAEKMDPEDYIRMRSYLAEQEMARFFQNSVF